MDRKHRKDGFFVTLTFVEVWGGIHFQVLARKIVRKWTFLDLFCRGTRLLRMIERRIFFPIFSNDKKSIGDNSLINFPG